MKHSAERRALKKAYPADSWAKKVDLMDDDQVIAVYMRLKQQGKI